MTLKTIIRIACVSCIIASVAACNGKKNDIKNNLEHFFNAFYEKDFDKARSYATPESDEVISLLESIDKNAPTAEKTEKPTIKIDSIAIQEDTLATAHVSASGLPNTVIMSLNKRDGKWLVSFDMRALARIFGKDPDAVENEFSNMLDHSSHEECKH